MCGTSQKQKLSDAVQHGASLRHARLAKQVREPAPVLRPFVKANARVARQGDCRVLIEIRLHRGTCFFVLPRCDVGGREKAEGIRSPPHSECVMPGERRDRILVAPGREIGEAKIRALPSVGLQYGHARRKSGAEEAYQSARSRPRKLPDHCARYGLIATIVLSSMSIVKTTFSPGSRPSSNAAESTL